MNDIDNSEVNGRTVDVLVGICQAYEQRLTEIVGAGRTDGMYLCRIECATGNDRVNKRYEAPVSQTGTRTDCLLVITRACCQNPGKFHAGRAAGYRGYNFDGVAVDRRRRIGGVQIVELGLVGNDRPRRRGEHRTCRKQGHRGSRQELARQGFSVAP